MFISLREATEPSRVGGKAYNLGRLLRGGVLVPRGFVIPPDVDLDHPITKTALRQWATDLAYRWAVRSSAVGEDGLKASFAGQHDSALDVVDMQSLEVAARLVRKSAQTLRATVYRQMLGIEGAPKVAVIVQAMIRPVYSAVVFTHNPLDGDDAAIVEIVRGSGDQLVGGKVTPATWEWRYLPGLDLVPVRRAGPSIEVPACKELYYAAKACEAILGVPADVEAVYDGERWWIVQARAITTLQKRSQKEVGV